MFTQLFGDLLAFVYHCFDRIVIYGYLSALSRPEQVVHFFRQVVGVPVVSKEVLSQRTADYQAWVEAFARNHRLPIEWVEKGARRLHRRDLREDISRCICSPCICGGGIVLSRQCQRYDEDDD